MTLSKMESMWTLISKYTFFGADDPLAEDLNCILCRRLMIDAVLSSACGCHYCYTCIHDYIGHDNTFCPGNKQFCGDEPLLIDKNAFRNIVLNKRIAKLKISCPNESCVFKVELMNLDAHLKLCEHRELSSYSTKTSVSTIMPRLHSNAMSHSDLLMGSIERLQKEVQELRDQLSDSKLQISILKDSNIDENKSVIRLMKDSITELEKKLNKESTETTKEVTGQRQLIGNLNKKIDELIDRINDEDVQCLRNVTGQSCKELIRNESQGCSMSEHFLQFKSDIESKVSNEMNALKNEMSERKQQIENARSERKTIVAMITDMMNDMNKMREMRQTDNKDNERRIKYWIKCSKLCPNLDVDFIWKIDQCSKRIDIDIYSEPFYSDNYKLCLYLYLGSRSGHLYLYCYVVKGHYDNQLLWPMKRAVTISIVDQDTLKPYQSETFTTTFNKPMRDRGGRVGTQTFVKYSSIQNCTSIVVNDSIVVSCLISDQ